MPTVRPLGVAVREARGEAVMAAGPPPTEWFEAKRTIGL